MSLLARLLEPEALSLVFQPVFEAADDGGGHAVHSFEALTRGPVGTNAFAPNVLFEYARRKGHEATLDRICLDNLLRAMTTLPSHVRCSFNVHASTLQRDAGFAAHVLERARTHRVEPSRLTIEIVEHAPDWSGRGFLRALGQLRDGGMRIALDDIGLGQSNYRMILDCRPDYFKIDRYVVQGCPTDTGRQAIIDSLVVLARKFGARVVAEGIESRAELTAVRLLGVDLLQGFLLSAPLPAVECRALLSLELLR